MHKFIEKIKKFEIKPFIVDNFLNKKKIQLFQKIYDELLVEMVFKWKLADLLVFDRTSLHCASKNINKKKLGFISSTKER